MLAQEDGAGEVLREDEGQLYSQRAKLYRVRQGGWRRLGIGFARLLKHQSTGAVRFVVLEENTHAVIANNYVVDGGEYCNLVLNT